MLKKILPIGIMLVLAGISFVASMKIAQSMAPKPKPKPTQTAKVNPAKPKPDQKVLSKLAQEKETKLAPNHDRLKSLISELRQAKKKVQQKQSELNAREQRLKIASDEIIRKTKRLGKLRADLIAALNPLKKKRGEILQVYTLIKDQEAQNLASTAKMWAKMEPANAARLIVNMFESSQQDSATKIIKFLPNKNLAAIMDEITLLDTASNANGSKSSAAVKVILKQLKVIKQNGKNI